MDNNVGGLDVAVALFHINEVTPHSTRLVLGWVTVFGQVYHLIV